MTEPDDYNPHIHSRPPKTRVELLAWKLRDSSDYRIRTLATTILTLAGIGHWMASEYQREQANRKLAAFRREAIAKRVWILRRILSETGPSPTDRPVHLRPKHDAADVTREEITEGRTLPKPRPNHHD